MITRTALDHAALTTSWNLLSTHSVTIRAMDIDDLSLETEFLGKLTLGTGHKRFLGPAIKPSASMALSAAKHIDQLALAASITLDAGEEYLGVACYVSDAAGEADFAMLIADEWQGCGIGRRLLSHLRKCATRRGIRRLSGEVVADNRPPCWGSYFQWVFGGVRIPMAHCCAA
jgi:GNAT superfamily N-acetyltransferase